MLWSFLSRLIIPLSLLVLALLLQAPLLSLAAVYQAPLTYLPYFILTLTLLLALFFNRARQFTLALLLILVYAVINTRLQVSLSQPATQLIYTSLSFGIPLAAVLLQFLPEKGLRNTWGFLLILCVLLPALTVYWILLTFPEHLALFQQPWPLTITPAYFLSVPASIIYLVAFLSSLWMACKHNSEYAAAVCSVLLFSFITLAFFKLNKISLLMFTAAGIALLISLVRSAHELAFRDELTGLRSRRALNERMRSLGSRFVIAMVDVDHFKKCNDRYGHDVGDNVLQMVATHLGNVKRGAAYRYGGEEFCVLFPRKNWAQCEPELETLRQTIADYSLYLRDSDARPKSAQQGRQRRARGHDGQAVSVTISIGGAERNPNHSQAQTVLKAADTALYQAKKKGRNRLIFIE